MPNTLDDVIAEIRENLLLLIEEGTCSWELVPAHGSPMTLRTLSVKTEPPKSYGVMVTVDANNIHAEYFGLSEQPKRFAVPRLPNGEYNLNDDGPLYEICEEIVKPLRLVRC